MRRTVLPLLAAAVVVAGLTGVAIAVASTTVFSATAFVQVYLDALARGDADGALAVPGVAVDAPDSDVVTDAALPGLDDIRLVSEVRNGDNRLVTYGWRSGGESGRTTFEVEPAGTRSLFFPGWRFARSPTAEIELDLRGDSRFRVGEADAVQQDPVAAHTVLVPGRYELGHRSALLTATTVSVLADAPTETVDAVVQVRAAPAFVAQLQDAVEGDLDECTAQTVLQPTGCPFGEQITDRIVSTPEWSMTSYPAITIQPGPQRGQWLVPETPGTARLEVAVRSLFDGSVSTVDRAVAFTVSYRIDLGPDDRARVTAVY